jgi:formylglycine-generating enzyme required for sulfatase activity
MPSMRGLAFAALFGGVLLGTEPEPDPGLALPVEPSSIVWIPEGTFLRGSDTEEFRAGVEICRRDLPTLFGIELCEQSLYFHPELPQRRIRVSAYGIDRTEVTNEAYEACIRAGSCAPPRTSSRDSRLSLPDLPVAAVRFGEARAYCEFVGGRLPTEAEWERAARGSDDRIFPWGNEDNPGLANRGGPLSQTRAADGYRYAAPVTSFPDARSPYGLYNMAGNVWEWTADRWDPQAYESSPQVDPTGPRSGGERVIRGGSWRTPAFQLRVTHRFFLGEEDDSADVGFRCAYDAR